MKKLLTVLMAVLFTCVAFAGCKKPTPPTPPTPPPPPEPVANVTDLNVTRDVLTFTGVDGATSYEVIFMQGDLIKFYREVTSGYVSLAGITLGGTYDVTVYTYKDGEKSDGITQQFSFLSMSQDLILEAEDGNTNDDTYRGNNLAHGGAYLGGINSAGQGVAFNVFCYEAGEYAFDCYYMTESVGSKNFVYVNGAHLATFSFDTHTGWGTASRVNTAKSTVDISLNAGWNYITVVKNGTEADDWGGWAELDYFVLHCGGKEYNPDEVVGDPTLPTVFRLEAEQAAHIVRVQDGETYEWRNTDWDEDNSNGNPAKQLSIASSGFHMVSINNIGQGLEWRFSAPLAGKYTLKVAYSHDNGTLATGVDRMICFYNSATRLTWQKVPVNDLASLYNRQFLRLGIGGGWDFPITTDNTNNIYTIELDLVQGNNYIYAIRETECWWELDYVELTYGGITA